MMMAKILLVTVMMVALFFQESVAQDLTAAEEAELWEEIGEEPSSPKVKGWLSKLWKKVKSNCSYKFPLSVSCKF